MNERIHRWFDNLPEPQRFYVFLTALLAALLPIGLSSLFSNVVVGFVVSLLGLFILAILTLSRVAHLRSPNRR